MMRSSFKKAKSYYKFGFTIVELLVVIVVIGILLAITFVSYGAITEKAVAENLKGDLISASSQLMRYHADNGKYPTSVEDCPNTDPTKICAKISDGNTYDYDFFGQSYSLCVENTNKKKYCINNTTSTPVAYEDYVDPSLWLTVGTQTWAKANLNVGTMVTGVTTQISGNGVEKYCYDNLESNCTTYGGLYQWNEMMNYSTVPYGQPGWVQDICPVGSHVPTDVELTTLTTYYGGESVAGGAMKAAPLSIPLAGFRVTDGSFSNLSSSTYIWSSSESGTSAWTRFLHLGNSNASRNTFTKGFGFLVRCVKN